MNTTTSNHTIAALIAHIVSECSPVDREAAYDEMLDSEGEVTVAGLTFYPSQIVKELDPTAYRCGVNDWADSEEWTEIEGDYYRNEDIEKAREEFVDGLRDELQDMQDEIEEREEKGVENSELAEEANALESFISEVERHSF